MDTMSCLRATSDYPQIAFLIGMVLLVVLIRRNQALTIPQTLMCLVGLRHIERTPLISAVQAGTFIILLGWFAYLLLSCMTPLS